MAFDVLSKTGKSWALIYPYPALGKVGSAEL
jgi:hypothetical protein